MTIKKYQWILYRTENENEEEKDFNPLLWHMTIYKDKRWNIW